jgi:hypothetical protein
MWRTTPLSSGSLDRWEAADTVTRVAVSPGLVGTGLPPSCLWSAFAPGYGPWHPCLRPADEAVRHRGAPPT